MSENSFSFRWGIPILDGGFTDVPNLFFDNYTRAGVKREEFLVILHLARYQYEMPDSESRPSVKTVAHQLGYSVRNVRKIFEKLEQRGFLKRHYRPGQTTVYDFRGFCRKVLDVGQGEEPQDTPEPEDSPELQDRGTPEPQDLPPRNWGTPEQQIQKQERENNNNTADDVVGSL
jgi:hypothetical protein